MNKLIKSALFQRKFVIILVLAIIAFGVYTYFEMPKQENPEAISPVGMITTIYPGARTEEVREDITEHVENAITGIDGVEKIQSVSRDNVSLVIVQLSYEVDKEKQWEVLRSELETIELPSDVQSPSLDTDLINTTGVMLSINTSDNEINEMKNIEKLSTDIKSKLNDIEQINETNILGILEENIIIDIDLEKLRSANLTLENINDILTAQNIDIPLGGLQTKEGNISISYNKEDSIEDIKKIVLGLNPQTNAPITLGSISEIKYEYTDDTIFMHNGNSSVLITSYFDKDSNILLAEEEINDVISLFEKELDENTQIDKIIFQPEDVKNSVNDFIINLLQAIVLVLIVVFIGMGYKNAFVVSVTIPLSIMLTIISMSFLNINIQQISIAALIISLGILVDNSIVITDAIQVKLDENISIMEAVYLGTKESSIPVLTSTLTTIMAFAPLITLPGEAGEFAKSLPQVVIIALIASYIVSITVTPVLASLLLKNSHRKARNRKHFKGLLENTLLKSMKYTKTTLFIVLVLIIISGFMLVNMRLEVFPYADNNIAYIDINAEENDIAQTQQIVEDVKEVLNDRDYINEYTSSIGGPIPKFYITNPPYFKSPDLGQVMFRFNEEKIAEYKNKKYFAYELQNELNDKIEGGTATVNLLALTNPGPDIDITLSADEFKDIENVANNIKEEMNDMNSLYNITLEQPSIIEEYEIIPNKEQMSILGLTSYDIQRQVNLALNKTQIGEVNIDDESKNILLYANPNTIDELQNIPIKSPNSQQILVLKDVVEMEEDTRSEELNRFNRKPFIKITAEVNPDKSTLVEQSKVEEIIDNKKTDDIKVTFGGEKEIFRKYLSGLGIAALIALVGVYLILLLQFRSILQPLIILITVPLSVIGVVFGVFIFRLPLTFTVGLGAASLIGIVVNNAILIIEYINREREKGRSIKEACIESAKKRLRPILLSSITTVIGLIPLVLSGSSFFTPLAVGLMVGLIFSTLLTLVVIPIAYNSLVKEN
ncbi:efflux RND transporter permease subunit [Senegalia massiliensis]|uniref:efflux RND transporter permease subunit n=1 Tax=Senegalia massiliensis TaxID=1720316 RepID=UPI00102F7E02|nr:efflux RND transporter permease subunit [Senegalia massiliensis]